MTTDEGSSPVPAEGHLAGLARWLLGDLPQDAVGLLGGDWLREVRIRNISRLRARSAEKLKERGISPDECHIDPSAIVPLVAAAQDRCNDEHLLELWARLLASAMDPATASLARRANVDLLKQLDGTDARVLNCIWTIHRARRWYERVPASVIARELGIPGFEVCISFAHLEQLKCISLGMIDRDWPAAQSILIGNALYETLKSPGEVGGPHEPGAFD
jgi:hypothetical protein